MYAHIQYISLMCDKDWSTFRIGNRAWDTLTAIQMCLTNRSQWCHLYAILHNLKVHSYNHFTARVL